MSASNQPLLFVSDKDLAPKKNLRAVIDYAKNDLSKIWPDKTWESNHWRIRHHYDGSKRNLWWSNINSKRPPDITPMQHHFCEFAKAYLVIRQSFKPLRQPEKRLSATRYLEHALADMCNTDDVTQINASVLDYAISFIEDRIEDPYQIAVEVDQIKDFLNEYHLTVAHISWHHGVKPKKPHIAVGEERIEYERKKLPPPELFDCLPKLIHKIRKNKKAEAYDIIPVEFLMLLASSPARAGELCYNLRTDFVWTNPENGMTYLRWYPEKGGLPVLKEVAPQMADDVQGIYKRLKKYTDEGRRIAKWYEKNPTSIYLPKRYEYLRQKEFLSIIEVGKILAKKKASIVISFLYRVRRKTNYSIKSNTQNLYSFTELEKALLAYYPLPESFPYMPAGSTLLYSEAFFTLPKDIVHYGLPTVPFMFENLTYSKINAKLASKISKTNIFARHGYARNDGSVLRVTSHSPRHLIEAIKKWKGISDVRRAKQAGRKDIKQNAWYDHLTANDIIEMAKESGVLPSSIIKIAERIVNAPVSFKEIRDLIGPYHLATEYGICGHDFGESPCERFGDHLMCPEQWYIKGAFPEKERLLKRTLEITEQQLKDAIEIDENGLPVYDKWAENHSLKVTRLKELIKILEDPDIPNGTLIHLNNNDGVTLTSRALENRLMLNRKEDKELLTIAKQIREIDKKASQKEIKEYIPELLRPFFENIDLSEFD